MEFLLIDVGIALAFVLGYAAFVVLERHRAPVVKLARAPRRISRA